MKVPAEITALLVIVGIALASVGAVSAFSARPHQESVLPTLAPPTPALSPTPVPAVLAGPLDGEPTPRKRALRRPIAVVLDNYYPDARPQAGLGAASVVYEALTEGGITRLLAVFLERDAPSVGPVRSARPYFVRWADSYRALFVHDGGSPPALQTLRSDGFVADVDASRAGDRFTRLPSHSPPHDLFTGTGAIWRLAQTNGSATPPSYHWLPHKAGAPPAQRGQGGDVTIDFSTPAAASPPEYAVRYHYDRARNVYLRFVGGVPSLDAGTSKQIAPANVVIMTARIAPIPNDVQQRIEIAAVGSGPATYLLDGRVIHGTWSKASAGAPLLLLDAGHHEIRLNRGTTWLEVVPRGAVRFGT